MLKKSLRPIAVFGFTLIELMIVVAIVGLLASTAIPLFGIYQLRTKSTEVKTNRSLSDLLGIPDSSCHDSILSRNGASGNPGAVQYRGDFVDRSCTGDA